MFALRQLTPGELLTATEQWVTTGAPAKEALEHGPATAGLFITMGEARNDVFNALGSLGADVPSDDATRLDQRHDDLVHAIFAAVHAASLTTTDEVRRASLSALITGLFPHGVAIVHASFADEAGEAGARPTALTPALRATLASITVEGSTLETWFGELQSVGAALGGVVDTRATADAAAAGRPRPKGKVLRAKNHLIQVIRTIESALITSGASADTLTMVMGPVRVQAQAAESRALLRAGTAAPPPAPAAPPAAPAAPRT